MPALSSQPPIEADFIEQLMSANTDLALANRLADLADQISLARYQALDLVIETKPDTTPVTDADRAVEEALRSLLAQERPNDLIIGEEFGGAQLLEDAEPGTRFWIIDPIDGTKNYLRGVPTWATLIAMGTVLDAPPVNDAPQEKSSHRKLSIGVVSSPALGRRWWALKGHGAYVTENFASASPHETFESGDREIRDHKGSVPSSEASSLPSSTRRISVSKVAKLADASISYSDLIGWGSRREPFIAILDHVWRTRAIGDFLSHMLVAEGAVDLAVEPSLALWDMAALAVIVEEAGGRYSSLEGVDGPFGASGVSSNGLLHEEFLGKVK